MKSRCLCSILGTYEVPESLREVVMIVLTSWKEAHSTYCLTMAQYCPQLGQLFAFARHKMMRREKIFGRSTIAIRNMFSGCRMRGFAREKPYSRFYPSPFTFSPETPINTGVVRGEGLAPPFTHPSPYHEVQPSLKTEAGHNRWLNMGSEMISHPKKSQGEGWWRVGAGSATPFTRINT